MPELTTDRIVQILLGLVAAGGLSFGGFRANDAGTCRELLQDQSARAQAREVADSDLCADTLEALGSQYAEAMDALRDICRPNR